MFRLARLPLLMICLLCACTEEDSGLDSPLAAGKVTAADPDKDVTGVSASSDSPGVISVSYTAPAKEPTDYRVRWSKADKSANGSAFPTATSHSFSGMEEGTEYFVRVRARYGDEKPGPWTGKHFVTVAATPATPEPEPPKETRQPDELAPPTMTFVEAPADEEAVEEELETAAAHGESSEDCATQPFVSVSVGLDDGQRSTMYEEEIVCCEADSPYGQTKRGTKAHFKFERRLLDSSCQSAIDDEGMSVGVELAWTREDDGPVYKNTTYVAFRPGDLVTRRSFYLHQKKGNSGTPGLVKYLEVKVINDPTQYGASFYSVGVPSSVRVTVSDDDCPASICPEPETLPEPERTSFLPEQETGESDEDYFARLDQEFWDRKRAKFLDGDYRNSKGFGDDCIFLSRCPANPPRLSVQRATGDGGAVTSGRTVDEGGTLWFRATLTGDNVGTTWGKNEACRAFEPKTGPTADGEINGEYTAFEFEFGPYEFGDRSGGTWDDKNDNGVLDEGEWIKDGIIETTWKDGAGFICSSGERDSNGIRSAGTCEDYGPGTTNHIWFSIHIPEDDNTVDEAVTFSVDDPAILGHCRMEEFSGTPSLSFTVRDND